MQTPLIRCGNQQPYSPKRPRFTSILAYRPVMGEEPIAQSSIVHTVQHSSSGTFGTHQFTNKAITSRACAGPAFTIPFCAANEAAFPTKVASIPHQEGRKGISVVTQANGAADLALRPKSHGYQPGSVWHISKLSPVRLLCLKVVACFAVFPTQGWTPFCK